MKFLLSVILLAAPAIGADALDSWQERQRESLTWSARGVTTPEEGSCRSPTVACRKVIAEVRNDHSVAPIYCGASFRFPQPNAYRMGEKGWQNWIPVESGKTAVVNGAWVPKDLAVAEIYTECFAKMPAPIATAIMDVTDRPPQAPPPVQASCSAKIKSVASINDYYPGTAKAEMREGAPVVRVTVKLGETTPDSITLVTSSGYTDLDEAAIQVAKLSNYYSSCEVGTVSFKVKFFVK